MTARNRRVEENQTRLTKQDVEGEGRVSRVTGDMRGKRSWVTRVQY